jgi:hypothetical protein
MKLNYFLGAGIALLLFTFTSCKKEQKNTADNHLVPDKNTHANANAKTMACMWGMIGYYGSSSGQFDSAYAPAFVVNGIARLGNSPFGSPFWTSVHTWNSQPDYCYLLGDAIGDTLTFSVRLKNPSSGTGSVSAWDVSLAMVGEQHTAAVSIIGNTQNQHYTYLKAGQSGVTNRPNLVRIFNNWTVLTLRTYQASSVSNILEVLQDGVLLESIVYNLSTSGVGKVKRFEIAFKGAGSVDWFRVSSSNSGTGLLRNEFDNITNWSGLQWF